MIVIGLIIILILIYEQQLLKFHIIEDLPTSSFKGVFIRLVEIKGTAKNDYLQKTFPL